MADDKTRNEETKARLRKMREDAKTYNPASYESLKHIWAELEKWLEKPDVRPEGGYL